MEEMTLNEAISEVQKYVNFFKAFQNLQRFIDTVVLAEQRLAQIKGEFNALTSAVASLRQERETIEGELARIRKEEEKRLRDTISRLSAKVSKVEGELKMAETEHLERVKVLDTEYLEKKKEYEEAIKKLEADREDVERKLYVANQKLSEIREKIGV